MSIATRAKNRSPRWLKDAVNIATRRYAVATVRSRPAPDYLIIGTKRGGTTSLHNYLLMHPHVLGLYPDVRGVKSTNYFFEQQQRGDAWYRSHFHTRRRRERIAARTGRLPLTGEASPYYVWDPRVAPRVRAVAPAVQAILLLRDPVERAWSHYQERVGNGVEPLDFAQALDAEQARTEGESERMEHDPYYFSKAHDHYSYAARGVYLPQIQHWLGVFDRSQLLILRSEDMYTDVQGVFDQVTDFLGLDGYRLPRTDPFNSSTADRMPDGCRRRLEEFYRPPNAALARFLDKDMQWSS